MKNFALMLFEWKKTAERVKGKIENKTSRLLNFAYNLLSIFDL